MQGETLPWPHSTQPEPTSDLLAAPRSRLRRASLLWVCVLAVVLGWWQLAPLFGVGGLSGSGARQRLVLGVSALMAALGSISVLAWVHWRAHRLSAHLLRRTARQLRRGDWEEAVHGMRDHQPAAPSGFGDLATQVEGVIGESERRWRARAELSSEWYWELDDRHRLSSLSADAPIAKPAGRALGDLLGRRHDELPFLRAPAGGWEAFHERMDRLEPLHEVEIEVDGPEKQARGWISLTGRPRYRRDGSYAGYEGVARDISEHKASWRRLQDSEQRYAVMAGLSADWYWATDAEHRYPAPDAELQRRFGSRAARTVGLTRWEVYPDALTPSQWQAHRDDLAARRAFRSLEFAIQHEDGSAQWVSISGAPRHDSQGRFVGYHGVGRDISLRKKAERMLIRHNRELQQAVAARTRELELANRDLDAFARHLAHELRTPLSHVLGLADLLRQRLAAHLEPADSELLDLQGRAARDMLATLEALLELARSSSEAIERREIDLTRLAEEVVATLPVLQRRAPVLWQVQPGLRVWASEPQLRIVLQNLLGNAAKFTRLTPSPIVCFECSTDAEGLPLFRVRDNGAGFDVSRAERLFQPFQRLHSQDEFHGTGIGLTIVQRVVQRHGGRIHAYSEAGQGARFEFNLGQRDAVRDAHAASAQWPVSSVEVTG